MTDSSSSASPSGKVGRSEQSASGVPYGGTATTDEVVAKVKEVSSHIYDFAGVPGKASEPGPGVKECQGKDTDTYFHVYHPWNFKPDARADNDIAMANLKAKLSTGGWVIKDSYRDNSSNKNLNLIADNDSGRVSVWIVAYSSRTVPSLGIQVTSGCYEVPKGDTVDHF
ncbi:hypothetical protein ACL02U_02660 [Streptomyces sp. MS06]|uniref:hypothetical protein n=1 Tax=Streptomyces sp. MS06 TaxID=3385974 RepID=UPI00399EFC06